MKRKALLAIAGAIASVLFVAPAAQAGPGGNQYKLLKLEGQLARWTTQKVSGATVVSYAFAGQTVRTEKARNCGAMQPVGTALSHSNISEAQFRQEFAKAARMWEEAANIRFVEAKSPETADILVGLQLEGLGRAFTNVELSDEKPAPGVKGIERSLICLNPDMPWKIGFDGNLSAYDLRYTLAHELGHAIGLDHPGGEGSLMFYKYDETKRGLTQGDMLGAAAIYGAGPKLIAAGAGTAPNGSHAAAPGTTDDDGAAQTGHPQPPTFALGAKP